MASFADPQRFHPLEHEVEHLCQCCFGCCLVHNRLAEQVDVVHDSNRLHHRGEYISNTWVVCACGCRPHSHATRCSVRAQNSALWQTAGVAVPVHSSRCMQADEDSARARSHAYLEQVPLVDVTLVGRDCRQQGFDDLQLDTLVRPLVVEAAAAEQTDANAVRDACGDCWSLGVDTRAASLLASGQGRGAPRTPPPPPPPPSRQRINSKTEAHTGNTAVRTRGRARSTLHTPITVKRSLWLRQHFPGAQHATDQLLCWLWRA